MSICFASDSKLGQHERFYVDLNIVLSRCIEGINRTIKTDPASQPSTQYRIGVKLNHRRYWLLCKANIGDFYLFEVRIFKIISNCYFSFLSKNVIFINFTFLKEGTSGQSLSPLQK